MDHNGSALMALRHRYTLKAREWFITYKSRESAKVAAKVFTGYVFHGQELMDKLLVPESKPKVIKRNCITYELRSYFLNNCHSLKIDSVDNKISN